MWASCLPPPVTASPHCHTGSFFSPLLIGTGGNAGSQTTATIIRALAMGESVALDGPYAYVGGSQGLWLLDVSTPSAPVAVGFYEIPFPQDTTVVGSVAYVAGHSAGLHVVDVSTPSAPVKVGHYDGMGPAVDTAVVGKHVYVAAESGGLTVLRFASTFRIYLPLVRR